MGNPFRSKSIHTSIAIAFAFIILCTTAVLSYNSYRLASRAVTENSLNYTTQLIDQVNTNIQTYIDNMESISQLALRHDSLNHLLELGNMNNPDGLRLEEQIRSNFRSIVSSRKDIASIMFVGSNGAIVSDRFNGSAKSYEQLSNQEWYQSAIKAKGEVVISSSHVQHIFLKEYKWVVSISRQLTSSDERNQGVLLVDLNYNVINDLCKQIQLGNRGYVFILDTNGDMIYHPQQQIIYTQMKSEPVASIMTSNAHSITTSEGSEEKIYTIGTTEFGWKIVGVTYPDELLSNKKQIQLQSVLWGMVCLIIALAISVAFTFTLTKPIKNLELHMKKVEKGDFDIVVDIDNTNEIGKLARTFNLMIRKIKDLMNQIVEEQEMKRISELKALQAQIQPHFLYNTLDSIIWMAEMGKVDEVVEMTTALSKLLRSSISKGEELIPIQTELDHIENYLTIQKMRYRHKFTYSIDVDPAIYSCKILKIVLQPLVENAIYHGIKNKVDQGHIRIIGTLHQDVIEIKVNDDGIGMSEEQLEQISIPTKPRSGEKSVGVYNVNHRIKLYFGESYGLSYESEREEGTTVTLRIPKIEEEEAHD
ncbi:sensor histidine kinase [Paenibacillus sp. N1-5-1-14]|uniref:sensor histidine kinase n=1 Tax=Paenibacillus radicibacter TaxID=2972488 RepID=UPI002158A3FA|nr:sensor histidine kinase [Paenibacillus radicibacter]MCR8645549.1 sensor histidine kinase [Paenibacillus radicibacter]